MTDKDQYLDARFPFGGVDTSHEVNFQPPGSTAVGENVRGFVGERLRGGSRSGISRYVDEQVNGEALIQHLNTITSVDAEAIGSVFNGQDFGFTGVYGGIGFTGISYGTDEEFRLNGGGGYPSTLSFDEEKYHLELEASTDSADIEETVTITATFKDSGGNTAIFDVDHRREVELRTNPKGRDGHLESQVTDGIANFFVTSDRQDVIVYSARDITTRKKATNTVEVTYEDQVNFIQARTEGYASSPGQSLAYSTEVQEGNLLVVAISTFASGATVSIIDTQGNTYTRAGNYQSGGSQRVSIWYAIAAETGPNTVAYTLSGSTQSAIGLLEYSLVDPIDPVDGLGGQSASASFNWSSGVIPVSGTRGLVIAAFAQGFFDLGEVTLTPGSGFNLRCNQPDAITKMSLYVLDKLRVSSDQTITGTVDVDVSYSVAAASFNREEV